MPIFSRVCKNQANSYVTLCFFGYLIKQSHFYLVSYIWISAGDETFPQQLAAALAPSIIVSLDDFADTVIVQKSKIFCLVSCYLVCLFSVACSYTSLKSSRKCSSWLINIQNHVPFACEQYLKLVALVYVVQELSAWPKLPLLKVPTAHFHAVIQKAMSALAEVLEMCLLKFRDNFVS